MIRLSRSSRWLLCALAFVLGVPLLAIAVIVAGGANRMLLRAVAARTQHPIEIRDGLSVHLFTRAPRIEARGVTIGNPHWMPAGTLARIDELVVVLDPSLRHPLTVKSLTLRGGELHPVRLDSGASNWSTSPPRNPPQAAGAGLPVIRGLELDELRLRIEDARRRLDFAGTIATRERDDARLQIDFDGELNGRPVSARLTGEALAEVVADRPWNFHFEERSSGTTILADGAIPEPFRFDRVTASFAARGEDLRDLWYLAGVRLPDTAPYRLDGHFARAGRRFEFTDLAFTARSTDFSGRVAFDSSGERGRLDVDLHSKHASLRDIGKGAAGRMPEKAGPKRLFADWKFPLEGLRARDGKVRVRADTLVVGPLTLSKADATFTLADRVVTGDPLTARAGDGTGRARVVFDAREERPHATVRLESDGLDVGKLLPGKSGEPPVSGALRGSLDLEGRGRSFDELFAGASGRLHLALNDGEMRSSLARLMELDLRALGLDFGKKRDRVGIRCAVVDAEAKRGAARLSRIVIDAEPVVISGDGTLSLDSEELDVLLKPSAKNAGLRLKSPLEVTGTLLQPRPKLRAGALGKQGAVAVALGALVAPIAAAAVLIDPGKGKDQDCATLTVEPSR